MEEGWAQVQCRVIVMGNFDQLSFSLANRMKKKNLT